MNYKILSFTCLILTLNFFSVKSQDKVKNSLVKKLTLESVYDNHYACKTLYTWTTKEQIEDLKRNKVLLTKEKSETKGYSIFDELLREPKFINNPISELLQNEKFKKKRFAWSNSWATVMGWEGESYGNQLIRIILKEDAIIGRFDPADEIPFEFLDISGSKVSEQFILSNPEKLAAIYFVNKKTGNKSVRMSKGGTFHREYYLEKTEESVPYREFIVCNESMVEKWSTKEIKNDIKNEIQMLRKLKKDLNKALREDWEWLFTKGNKYLLINNNPTVDWTLGLGSEASSSDIESLYYLSIAFTNDYYNLTTKNIGNIIKKLSGARRHQKTHIEN